MRKFNLELPKYRLEFHTKLIRRRKPLVSEPLVPSIPHVKRKYRSGSLVGKIVRYLADHKATRKVFVGNLAAFAIASSFIPTVHSNDFSKSENVVIETQNILSTEVSTQAPLDHIKINQGYSFFHPAVDLGAEIGTPVSPMRAGEVEFASYTKDGYGNQVLINHGRGLKTRYAHLSKIFVKVGQKVTTDSIIGLVGITGHTTGPHLHFEVSLNEIHQNPLSYFSLK